MERLQPLTRTIPHFIDREALNARANAFERKLRAGGADKGSLRRAIFDSKKFDKMLTRTIGVDDDTFFGPHAGWKLRKCGRKGWLASIEAFAAFQRENPDLKTHLWIHSVDNRDDAGGYESQRRGRRSPWFVQASICVHTSNSPVFHRTCTRSMKTCTIEISRQP